MVQKQSHESQRWQVSLTSHQRHWCTRDTDVTAKIGEPVVKDSSEENLLGVKIDTKLSFKDHVSFLCKNTSQKLHALARQES